MIPHEILEFIQGRYSHRTKKKDQYGEVFTPIELVDELVSHIPVKWTDSNTKILDPASGIGNFPVVIYYKLMDSLSKTIPEKKRRSKHIINNMLFMVEIDTTNVKQCRELFKLIDPHATPNISHCDFLLGIKEVPVNQLIPGKTYCFFSHTKKKQPQKRPRTWFGWRSRRPAV